MVSSAANSKTSIWFDGQKLLRQIFNFNPETVSTEIDPQDPEVQVVKTVLSTTTIKSANHTTDSVTESISG